MTSISTSAPPLSNLLTSPTTDAPETGSAPQGNIERQNEQLADLQGPKLTLTQGADRMLAANGQQTAMIQETAGENIPELTIEIDESQLPDGLSLNDLTSAEFVFDTAAGTVTPTLTFTTQTTDGSYLSATAAPGLEGLSGKTTAIKSPTSSFEGFGGRTKTTTSTTTITTSPQTTTTVSFNAKVTINILGSTGTFKASANVTTSSGRTVTATTSNGGGIEKPPEKSGSGTPAKSPKTGAK